MIRGLPAAGSVVFRDRILTPLGMTNTSFTLDGDMESQVATMHQRGADGTLEPTDFRLPDPRGPHAFSPRPVLDGRGLSVLHSDVAQRRLGDVEEFETKILRPDTVEFAAQNHLGDLKVKMLPG